jgi:UDP-GlcNAc:undecaprenyl-phosphate GlcNAc-1-phosphate transferase
LIKLAIQILAAVIAILHGVVWDYISSGGGTVSTGLLAYPLTIFWIVACTNAVNLIDGLDGLAAGISSISSLTMLLVAYFLLEPEVAVILAAVFGACIGFLPYNINPAKIFMGDTGSQFLGYILATASMLGLFKFYAIFTIFVPLVSLVYPLMDTGFAFLRRISHGESPFHADRKHLHHRLLDAGFSPKQAVGILCSGSAFLCLMPIIRVSPFMWLKILCLAGMFATLYIIIMIFIRRNGAAK